MVENTLCFLLSEDILLILCEGCYLILCSNLCERCSAMKCLLLIWLPESFLLDLTKLYLKFMVHG